MIISDFDGSAQATITATIASTEQTVTVTSADEIVYKSLVITMYKLKAMFITATYLRWPRFLPQNILKQHR